MLIQMRYGVVDDETIECLKDTIEKRMSEELGKLRNEIVNMGMTDNNGVMVQRGMQSMPKFGATDIKFGVRVKWATDVKVWHNKFLSIMDGNVTWMSYKKAILRRFGKSVDGSSREFSSSKSVGDSSLYSGLVDKLEELLVNGSHFLEKNTCVYNVFDEMPIKKSLKQEWVKEVSDPIDDKRAEYSDEKEPFEVGSGLVDDVAVEAVTSSAEVENRLVDDVVVDKDGGNVNEHTKFSSVGCIQKDANLLDICSDLRYVEGREYGNKGCKVATCDDLLHTNVKQEGNLEKATTCFAHMSSRTRNESSVSRRIKDTHNMEILTYSLEVGSVEESTRSDFDESSFIVYLEADENNGDNFGYLKFDKWKWPKRSRKRAKCKLDESDDERVTGNGLETKVIETSLGIDYLENFLVATSRLLEEWHGHYTAVTCFVISMDVSHLNYDNEDGCVRVWHLYEYCVGHNNKSMNLILPEVCWKCEVHKRKYHFEVWSYAKILLITDYGLSFKRSVWLKILDNN
nr:hypothetical protein [Tanacetum cinerariifolium]